MISYYSTEANELAQEERKLYKQQYAGHIHFERLRKIREEKQKEEKGVRKQKTVHI